METLLIFILLTLVLGLTVTGHWLDKRYDLQVMRWLNCEVASPFKAVKPKRHSAPEELRERIENLEKIVTDSRWELEQKLNKL